MKYLKHYIKQILFESADPCSFLTEKQTEGLFYMDINGMFITYFNDGYAIQITIQDHDSSNNIARFTATRNEGYCEEAFITGGAFVFKGIHQGKGLGAILYDLAFELAGEHGLMADRSQVSEDAYRMWDYAMRNPDIYKPHQLDEYPHALDDGEYEWFLSATDFDDCGQESTHWHLDFNDYEFDKEGTGRGKMVPDSDFNAEDEYTGGWLEPDNYYWYSKGDKYKQDFLASPISKYYVKNKTSNSILSCLKALKLVQDITDDHI